MVLSKNFASWNMLQENAKGSLGMESSPKNKNFMNQEKTLLKIPSMSNQQWAPCPAIQALFRICWGQNKFSISACVGAGTSGFWTGLSVKTSEFSETRSPSFRFSIVSSRSAFTFLADLKLILRTREYSTLFGKLGSTRGHWICVQESLSLIFV